MSNTTSSIRGVSGQETLTNFKRVQASSLEGDNINVTNATITNAKIANASINSASIRNLRVVNATVTNLIAVNATIRALKASSLIASYLNFTATRGAGGVGLRYRGGDLQSRHQDDIWRPLSHATEKFWGYSSPSGQSGTFYYGGFYAFAGTADDLSATPATQWGTANSSYATHFMVVLGATAVDKIVLRIKGTKITDGGVRTADYEATLAIPNAATTNNMYETPEKFIGQITAKVISGTAKSVNYGFAKYWDNNNNNFTIKGFETTWLGGASDGAANISILHHKVDGWTYNVGAIPDSPTPVADMATDHVTEIGIVNGEEGAWKRDNLDEDILGSEDEGTILRIVTSANKTFTHGSMTLRIEPLPN